MLALRLPLWIPGVPVSQSAGPETIQVSGAPGTSPSRLRLRRRNLRLPAPEQGDELGLHLGVERLGLDALRPGAQNVAIGAHHCNRALVFLDSVCKLGDAAVRLEPLGGIAQDLAQRQLALLLELPFLQFLNLAPSPVWLAIPTAAPTMLR